MNSDNLKFKLAQLLYYKLMKYKFITLSTLIKLQVSDWAEAKSSRPKPVVFEAKATFFLSSSRPPGQGQSSRTPSLVPTREMKIRKFDLSRIYTCI